MSELATVDCNLKWRAAFARVQERRPSSSYHLSRIPSSCGITKKWFACLRGRWLLSTPSFPKKIRNSLKIFHENVRDFSCGSVIWRGVVGSVTRRSLSVLANASPRIIFNFTRNCLFYIGNWSWDMYASILIHRFFQNHFLLCIFTWQSHVYPSISKNI